jgi:hypothetical protein
MRFRAAEAHCTKDMAVFARRYGKINLLGDRLTPLVWATTFQQPAAGHAFQKE